MIDKLTKVFELLGKIPADVHALALILAGSLMTVCKQHDLGLSLVASGLAIFKGKS